MHPSSTIRSRSASVSASSDSDNESRDQSPESLPDVCCIGGHGVTFPALNRDINSSNVPDSLAPDELGALHAEAILGEKTVCIVLSHGVTGLDGRHALVQQTNEFGPNSTVPTIEVLRRIRNMPVGDQRGANDERPIYTGPIWLFACHDLNVLAELEKDKELLSQGYIVISGSEHVLDRTVAERNIADLGDYLAHCRSNQTQPNHAQAFITVLLDGGETAAIAGGDLEYPLVFHAPTTYEELQRNSRVDEATRLLKLEPVQAPADLPTAAKPGEKAMEQAWLVMAGRSSLHELAKLAAVHPPLLKKSGEAALLKACSAGQCETAEWLIACDVLGDAGQVQCYSALSALCGGTWDAPMLPAVIRLVDRLLELARAAAGDAPAANESGLALIAACYTGRVDLLEHLRAQGISVNVANRRGRTPLMAAAAAGHLNVVMALCREKNSGKKLIDQTDKLGNTALAHAVACRRHEAVPALLAKGANVSTTNNARQTPLSYACAEGDLEMVRLLLKFGAANAEQHDLSFDAVCKRGRPGTGQARIEIAKLLLENGFIPDESHVEKATDKGHEEIAELLRSRLNLQ